MKAHLLMSAGQVGAQEEGGAPRNPSQNGHQQLHREQSAVRWAGQRVPREEVLLSHREDFSNTLGRLPGDARPGAMG